MNKIMVVFGTRPEAIKMCPLVRELKARPDEFECVVVTTGQHKEMLEQVLTDFDVTPDYDLKVMSENQTLFDITSKVLLGTGDIIKKESPDVVLVHGDTTTAFAAGLAAFYTDTKIGHVEAGLRTYNLHSPFPEEYNRQATDLIADYYFAPTQASKQNLLNEGKDASKIYVTGNTGIDAMKYTVSDDYTDENIKWAEGSKLILITAHRRENLGEPMKNMFKAIKRVLDENPDTKAIYPIHLNPKVRATAHKIFDNDSRIRLIEPLDVIKFHNYLKKSYLILTDSGGIQEEAPSLGKPVLVMRDTTERPEGVEAGTLRLVGTSEEGVYNAFTELLNDHELYKKMSETKNPYGTGDASEKICDVLSKN